MRKIDKKIASLVEPYVIEIKKPLEWQVKAYMNQICPDLDQEHINRLYDAAGGDIYRITNELDKVNCFDAEQRLPALVAIMSDKHTDLVKCDILTLADKIVARDIGWLSDYEAHKDQFNFDAVALSNLLLGKYKSILYAKYGTGIDFSELGISTKSFYYARDYKYQENTLANIIKFLSGFDARLKNYEFAKIDTKNANKLSYLQDIRIRPVVERKR